MKIWGKQGLKLARNRCSPARLENEYPALRQEDKAIDVLRNKRHVLDIDLSRLKNEI